MEEVKVSAILSGKAQHLLHGSISNSLTGTHTNTHREYKMRTQNKTISQTSSVIQKQTKRKDGYYVRLEWDSSNYAPL